MSSSNSNCGAAFTVFSEKFQIVLLHMIVTVTACGDEGKRVSDRISPIYVLHCRLIQSIGPDAAAQRKSAISISLGHRRHIAKLGATALSESSMASVPVALVVSPASP
jgi:hypothetical protein